MKKQPASILVIDDNEDVLLSARMYLKQHFSEVETCHSPRKMHALLDHHDYELILLDMNYGKGESDGREGLYWLNHILSLDRNYIVVMMTAYGDVDLAVNALKMGATDFILKPWSNEKLLATITAGLKLRQTHQQLTRLEARHRSLQSDLERRFLPFKGTSPALRSVYRTVEKVAPSDANVLILGENGTGKQVVAHEIHNLSPRAHSAFMHVDLGSLNENLFESELFGHARGAFTDAREDKPGRFELAEDGTFFLDEIGNLPLSLQGKLLTVLQNRKVIRLGENKERPFDIRLISATNQPVYEMVQKGSFREDLLYRINTVTIELPPLRERREDILSLARHFLQIYAHKYHKVETTLDARAKKALANYNWPGNIRELQHVIERAVIMSEDNLITDADLNLVPLTARNKTAANEKLDLETMEKAWIRKALKKHNGNISKASEDLGLTRAALYRRMDKYGI